MEKKTNKKSKHKIGSLIIFSMKNSLLFHVIVTISLINQVFSSPPIDYLIFNGENHQNHQHLKQLKTIFNNSQDEQTNQLNWKIAELLKNSSHHHDDNQVDIKLALQAWNLMQQQAIDYAQNKVDMIRPLINQLMIESNISESCQGSINHWFTQLTKLDNWAVLMWNAWGQFPSPGLFEGAFTDLGSYRSCMSASDSMTQLQQQLIGEPQYCTLDFQPIVPKRPRFHNIFARILEFNNYQSHLNTSQFGFNSDISTNDIGEKYNHSAALHRFSLRAQYFYYVKFRIGSCFPTKCSLEDIQNLTSTAGQRAILQATTVECQKREPVILNTYQIVAIVILGSLLLVAVIGTFVDLLLPEKICQRNCVARNLIPFSLWSNMCRLFDTNSVTVNELTCIQGLRFLSMLWVIYGHTILFIEYQTFTHIFKGVEDNLSSLFLLPTLNANFSVDTFFVISGILTSYVTHALTRGDKRRFNKFAFAVSRYIRLTPQLGIVILCFFLLPLLGDGPIYKHVTQNKAENCYKNWWVNLLYAQSFLSTDKDMCIIPSWWLSIEMFFHVASIIVIAVMLHDTFRGMLVNFSLAGAMALYGAYIHYTHGLAIQYLPAVPQKYEVDSEQTLIFFHRPWPHAASYFIGLALGFVISNETVKKISKSQLIQGWVCCFAGLFTVWFAPYYWNLGAPYTQWQSTLYYNVCQIIWPLSIAWIIWACAMGYGGIIDKILSARIFVPFGRITYMTYLSHMLVVYHTSAVIQIQTEPTLLIFLHKFVSIAFVSLLLGTLLTVIYESPLLHLQKRLLSYLSRRFDPSSKSNEKNIKKSMSNSSHQNHLDKNQYKDDDDENEHEQEHLNQKEMV